MDKRKVEVESIFCLEVKQRGRPMNLPSTILGGTQVLLLP